MTELKRICPFCGGEMIGTIGHQICHYNLDCVIHDESVPRELLDLLADTKKKLDIAVDALRHADWFFDGDYIVYTKDMHNEIKFAIKAIEQINQKEEQ